MAMAQPDLMDFFDPAKKINKVVLKAPDFGSVRRTAYDEPPPDTDESFVCDESAWRSYIDKETRTLAETSQYDLEDLSEFGTVVRSDMDGIEGRSTTAPTTIAVKDGLDDVNLCEKFDFEMSGAASAMPILDYKESILEMISSNQIVIISGPTGCGKSTQVPQYILDSHAMQRKPVNIIVTQPRKIAASSVARRVCQERGWKIGGLVGYQVGLDRAHKSADTRLLYATTGVLKRIIIAKKTLSDYTHIILDEVHDREEDMDLVLLICKKLLFTNSRATKLVLMSATLNEDKLANYFASHLAGVGTVMAPVVSVGNDRGTKHCSVFHIDDIATLMKKMQASYDDFEFDISKPLLNEKLITLSKLILTALEHLEEKEYNELVQDDENKPPPPPPGSVLVFLPGLQEIMYVQEQLNDRDDCPSGVGWELVPLHSSVSFEDQQKIYNKPKPHHRKIILSTNIAESSLTVPDIKYVIDFCLTKNMQADRETNYPRLMLAWACENQLTQRAGRAGRIDKDGRVFRMIPKEFAGCLDKEHKPEMLRIPLTNVVLDVKLLDLGSPKQLLALAMDPPEMLSIQKAVLHLKEIGALLPTVNKVPIRDDGDLTVLGEIIARLPLDVKLGKLIVLGHMFGVLEEAIIIAAGLNGKNIFKMPFDKRVQAYKAKLYWADSTFSDCFAVLLAYQTWITRRNKGEFSSKQGAHIAEKKEEAFCQTSFVEKKALDEMRKLVEDITKSLKMMNIEPLQIQNPIKWEGETKFLVLKLVMFGAFYPNYFTKQVSNEIELNAHRVLLGKDPKTTVYLQGMDENHAPYGEIYTGQIKGLFKECCKDDGIDLSFDGRKIYVEFLKNASINDRSLGKQAGDDSSNLTGDIAHQVYVAIKLRNSGPLNRRLKINLYGGVEIAQLKHDEWKEAIIKAAGKELESSQIDQIAPPGMNISELKIERVTHVSSPSMFWVQTNEVIQQDARLQAIINQVLSQCPQVGYRQEVIVGKLFLAPFKDEDEDDYSYYRARVNTDIGPDKYLVFFIDYGNVGIVEYRNLRVITAKVLENYPDLITTPGLAQECSIAGVQPDKLRSSKGMWEDDVVTKFRSLLLGHMGGRMISKIFSVTRSGSGHSKFVVNLETLEVKLGDNTVVDVKKQLIHDKLADHAVESYLSQDDHRERIRFHAYNSAMQAYKMNPYTVVNPVKVPNGFKEDKKAQPYSLSLQGPFSPLEHRVMCSYRTGSSKCVNMDPESVNAVMLNASPSDPHDQWMVSAHVAMSPNSESLMVRNTTWLPSKPGLGAMATMIFSPQVEVRLNKSKSKITGFIAGLGPKTIWDKPSERVSKSERTHGFYPEHDMEVKLDVSINNADINLINKLRYWMNQMMTKSPDGTMHITQPKSLDAAQKGLKRNLMELLDKERRFEEKMGVPVGHAYRWNMLERKHRLKSKVDEQNFFYKMIDGVHIQEIPNSEAVLEKLIKLYTKMDLMDINPLPYYEVCPVCPGQLMLTTPRDLHHHLNSSEHKYEENMVVESPETIASSSCA